MQALRYSEKRKLLKSWPPGWGGAHNRGNLFLFIWRKYFKNLLIELHLTRKAEIYVKAF
jgi:hypothetical protein